MCELISTEKKTTKKTPKCRRGINCRTFSQNLCTWGKATATTTTGALTGTCCGCLVRDPDCLGPCPMNTLSNKLDVCTKTSNKMPLACQASLGQWRSVGGCFWLVGVVSVVCFSQWILCFMLRCELLCSLCCCLPNEITSLFCANPLPCLTRCKVWCLEETQMWLPHLLHTVGTPACSPVLGLCGCRN